MTHQVTLQIQAPRSGLFDITEQVQEVVAQSKIQCGMCHVFLQHTSCSLVIQENADPSVRTDLETIFSRLAPDADPGYEHNYEGDDDMAAHIRTALTNVNLCIPISGNSIVLGTWQGIYLWEHRTHPHNRRVHLHIIGE